MSGKSASCKQQNRLTRASQESVRTGSSIRASSATKQPKPMHTEESPAKKSGRKKQKRYENAALRSHHFQTVKSSPKNQQQMAPLLSKEEEICEDITQLVEPATISGNHHLTENSSLLAAAATNAKIASHSRRRAKKHKRAKQSIGRANQRPQSRIDTASESVTVAMLACQAASVTSKSPNQRRRRYTGASASAAVNNVQNAASFADSDKLRGGDGCTQLNGEIFNVDQKNISAQEQEEFFNTFTVGLAKSERRTERMARNQKPLSIGLREVFTSPDRSSQDDEEEDNFNSAQNEDYKSFNLAKIAKNSFDLEKQESPNDSLDYNFISLDSNLRNKIKMQQVNTRAEMANSVFGGATSSSQPSAQAVAPRGKPPIQPGLVQSMSLREAFGAGHSSSSTKEEKQQRTTIKPKQALVISGKRQLIGNNTSSSASHQHSVEKLRKSSRLSITLSGVSLPCATPQSGPTGQSPINRQTMNGSAASINDDSFTGGMRTEMAAHRAKLIGKMISMDQNSMSKLLMDTGYEKAHMQTLQTPEHASESLPLACNQLSKASPIKKRNHNPSLSEQHQQQQSSQARKSKRVQVRTSYKPSAANSQNPLTTTNTPANNTQTRFPTNRSVKAPTPHAWSTTKQMDTSKYKSRQGFDRTNTQVQGALSSVRSKISEQNIQQQSQQTTGSQACPQFDISGCQIRPLTVPGQQQRLSNNNSSQKTEVKVDQLAPMANMSGTSHRLSHQKQISISSAYKRAEQQENQNGANNNFLLREAQAEQQPQQQEQFQSIQNVNSTVLDHLTLAKATTLKPRAPTEISEVQQNQTTMLHIPQQVQHPRQKSSSNQSLTQGKVANHTNSGFELSSFIKPVHVKQEEFFMLDNQNRVILVSMNPNAAAQPPQQKVSSASGSGKPKSIKRQGNQSFTNENFTSQSMNGALHATLQQHTQQPLIGTQQVSCQGQQKIVEQMTGKPSTKRKVSMANHQALKENSEQFTRQESAHLRGSDMIEQKQTSSNHSGFTRNDTIGQKANRNSNQSIKMAGSGVSRFGSTATNFSATTSNYSSIIPPIQPAALSAPPKGFIYQMDQNGNYVMAPQQLAGVSGMSAQLRQMQMMQPGQRPQANQVYFSNLQLQQQQQQVAHMQKGGHPQQAQQLQYQSNQTSSQQSIQQQNQGSSRPRPRSSAPAATVTGSSGGKRSAHGGQGNIASRDHGLRVQLTNSVQHVVDLGGGEEGSGQQHRLTSENLIQTAGHIIVTNSNGTPHNELQMPMIINQSAASGQGSLQMMNVTHALDHPQLILQQVSNRRDGSANTQNAQHASSTQKNGFFVKRNKRDSKTGLQHLQQQVSSQQTTPQTTSNSSKVTIGQQGANGQSFFLHESITSSQHRPSTGSHHHGSSFHHKQSANVSSKLHTNSRVSHQPPNQLGESDSENTTTTHRATAADSVALSGLTLAGNRSSLQGQQQQQQQQQQQLQNQKNLPSVRSGQLINYQSSICVDPDVNTSSKEQLVPHKQNSFPEKPKNLNSSASPSTKITIRGRKGINSIIGNGVTAQGVAGPGLQMLPSTPKTYKRTKRVLFARRMNLMDRPLLVITFQGVIGDFMKKQQVQGLKEVQIQQQPTSKQEKKQTEKMQKEEETVHLRAGAADGLKYLSSLFQLIIFSRETVEDSWFQSKGGQQPQSGVQTSAILNWIQSNPEIKLDGFYTSTVIAKQQTMTDDYSQIFIDFGLNSEQKIKEKVLFVNSIESEFFCNQRLPASGNLSPRGKKPTAAQLGISNARGLTDVDPYGYFMFDTSCQPAQPLVYGVPISIDAKHQKQTSRLMGARSSSLIGEQQQQQQDDNASCNGTEPDQISTIKTCNMPTTLLVPNPRTQHSKLQTNFQHVIKTIMMLAFMGQKKSAGKHLIKESSARDLGNDLSEIEAMFGSIKEKQVRLTKHIFHIAQSQQITRGMTETAGGPASAGFQNNLNKSQKAASLQRRIRQAQGTSVGCSVVGMGAPPRDTESPTSDMSGRNGSRGRRLKHQGSGKNQLGFKPATMTSSRTAATTHMANEITGSSSHSNPQQQPAMINVHQLRASSINSEKGATYGAEPNSQLLTNESQTHILEQSPRVMGLESDQKQVTIDLSDGAFFINLSWSAGVDYLSQRPLGQQKRFLGMQALCSDIVWRFYKRQAEERIKLRQLYEARMQVTEELVTNTLANETIVKNQQKSIDQIYEILRSRDLVGNPFGFTMGRNYRFFANLKFQMRRKLTRELEQWKARNEAATACQKPKGDQSTATAVAAGSATTQVSERVTPMSAKTASVDLQVLQQQQHEAIEELLEKNKLMNRFVVVGLDAHALK